MVVVKFNSAAKLLLGSKTETEGLWDTVRLIQSNPKSSLSIQRIRYALTFSGSSTVCSTSDGQVIITRVEFGRTVGYLSQKFMSGFLKLILCMCVRERYELDGS